MVEKRIIKRRYGVKQINIWVDENVLDRWDTFTSEYGVNRTQLIITAVNEYMENHGLHTTNGVSKIIEEKLAEIKDVLDIKAEVSESEQEIINDPKVKARILKSLENKPSDSGSLSFILGIDEGIIVEVLSELREQPNNLVKIDKEMIWHVVEN